MIFTIMRFLKYLFFKYYYWHGRIRGFCDSCSTILIMSFIFMFYFLDAIMISAVLFDKTIKMSVWMNFIVIGVTSLVLYFLLVFRAKDKTILKKYKTEWMRKKNSLAILIGILPIILCYVSLILMGTDK